jgi:hypothetical protein
MNVSLGYQQGLVTFTEYYQHLNNLTHQKNIDLSKTPAFNQYIQYVLMSDGIKPDALFKETEKRESETYQSLAITEQEKNLIQKSKTLYLTKKLTQFEMTSDEWDEYKLHQDTLALLSPYKEFYALADQRSEKMMGNLKNENRL